MKQSLIELIKIPRISDDCSLCFIQNPHQIPFSIKRVYYILQSKPGLPRGSHAHFKTDQILFCLQGNVKMILDDGKNREEVIIDQPDVGIFLRKMIWHEMHNLQQETILLVLASDIYKEEDYIRDYSKFLKLVEKKKR